MFDPESARQNDLRGGTPPWASRLLQSRRSSVDEDFRCDVLVVGAGITGSFAAEQLASLGHGVSIIDRQRPGFGSTAASTAMLRACPRTSALLAFLA